MFRFPRRVVVEWRTIRRAAAVVPEARFRADCGRPVCGADRPSVSARRVSTTAPAGFHC